MEAVAHLHENGFCRPKIFGYIKEGLGTWRHILFASGVICDSIRNTSPPSASGSLPGYPVAEGGSVAEVASDIVGRYPELVAAARGLDSVYVSWYACLLSEHSQGIIEMESKISATIEGFPVKVPQYG